MKVYIASSRRNRCQPAVVAALRKRGLDVYDFHHPPPGDATAPPSPDISFGWQECSSEECIRALDHPNARAKYISDAEALEWCDALLLVLPCGRSAHLEAGWAVGAGKRVVILLDSERPEEPELMYLLANAVVTTITAAVAALEEGGKE